MGWRLDFGLLVLFYVLGNRYRMCPATAPILLDLRVNGEVRQVTVVRRARRESS